jgi:putrescine aminotransferase
MQQQAPMLIREVRGRGLMIGVELPDPRLGPLLTVLLAERGVLALYANNNPATLIVMPPLVISADEVDEILGAFAGAFEAMAAQVG